MTVLGGLHHLVRPFQAPARIGFVGGDGDDHGRDPVAVLAIRSGADRERHHGHKWAVDVVTTCGQAPTEGAGTQRDDDIVECQAGRSRS